MLRKKPKKKKIDIEKGKAEGENKKAIEVAKKMLAIGLPLEQISEISGLSIEEVKVLAK